MPDLSNAPSEAMEKKPQKETKITIQRVSNGYIVTGYVMEAQIANDLGKVNEIVNEAFSKE